MQQKNKNMRPGLPIVIVILGTLSLVLFFVLTKTNVLPGAV